MEGRRSNWPPRRSELLVALVHRMVHCRAGVLRIASKLVRSLLRSSTCLHVLFLKIVYIPGFRRLGGPPPVKLEFMRTACFAEGVETRHRDSPWQVWIAPSYSSPGCTWLQLQSGTTCSVPHPYEFRTTWRGCEPAALGSCFICVVF